MTARRSPSPGAAAAAFLLTFSIVGPPTGFAAAQNGIKVGLGRTTWCVDFEAATAGGTGGTGNQGPQGVQELGGRFYVAAQGSVDGSGNWVRTAPHTVYVLDRAGGLVRSFTQSSIALSDRVGWRDGASDGLSLMFVSRAGIHVVDPNGNTATHVRTSRGLIALGSNPIPCSPTWCPLLGAPHGLAFDPNGNRGFGSFWVANGQHLWRVGLDGAATGAVVTQPLTPLSGLELDPVARTLWAGVGAPGGDVVEINSSTGVLTGRRFARKRSAFASTLCMVQGGLDGRVPALGGQDLVGVERGAVGELVGYRAHLWDAVRLSQERSLRNGKNAGTLDSATTPLFPTDATFDFDVVGPSVPYVAFLNAGTDASACGDVTHLGPLYGSLVESIFVAPFTVPAGAAVDFKGIGGTPVRLPVALLAGIPFGALRLQALYVEPAIGGAGVLPLIATNPVLWDWQSPPPCGIDCLVAGPDSATATEFGFWQVTNNNNDFNKSIVRLTLDFTQSDNPSHANSVFDTDDPIAPNNDRFDGANSSQNPPNGCRGTYRNQADVAAGLIYANTQVSGCDASALTGWVGSNPGAGAGEYRTLDFRFTAGQFRGFIRFGFDCDSDGGAGGAGGDMDGLFVRVEKADGTVLSGRLRRDPNDASRAVLQL